MSSASTSSGFETLRKLNRLENILRDSIGLYEIRKVQNENVKGMQ